MAMTSFAIRPMRATDAPQVLGLARSLNKWFNEEGLAQMARDFDRQAGFVATRGDRVIGFLLWDPMDRETANLSWIGVAELDQRSGVGRALLANLLPRLREAGFRAVEVSTVADSLDYAPYAATRAFYRAMGFVDHRVDSDYYGDPSDPYDRLVMQLDLTTRRAHGTGELDHAR